jgi:hypothetical protein
MNNRFHAALPDLHLTSAAAKNKVLTAFYRTQVAGMNLGFTSSADILPEIKHLPPRSRPYYSRPVDWSGEWSQ